MGRIVYSAMALSTIGENKMGAIDKYTLEELVTAKIKMAEVEHYLSWLPSEARLCLGKSYFTNIKTIEGLKTGIQYLIHAADKTKRDRGNY